jgi:hypothetical protein
MTAFDDRRLAKKALKERLKSSTRPASREAVAAMERGDEMSERHLMMMPAYPTAASFMTMTSLSRGRRNGP